MADSNINNPYAANGPSRPADPPPRGEGDSTGGIIPYKNPAALVAYYLGLFSLFPLIGFFLGVPAFILGIKGLRDRKRNPVIKGSVHAWIGIIMGGLMAIVWGVIGFGLIVTLVSRP